ncbi:hypothetical protein SDC9_111873 [bioreactor metagenome]|uniref:Tetratricopeptide repeat protein n=1 Tax=bioreactor metagenome TaxID=1076179 RepID=A0A645BKB7_9ZZZZ
MAALVCDICGGKLVMGSGGIAICESCGMEHSPDRMKEKIQEIKGTVRVDNTHMIANWMKMGTAAAQAGNHQEAYDYFAKVIEVDPENWQAIYEKGKAGAWQSTLDNLRTTEIYQGITNALDIILHIEMSEEELVSVKNEFALQLYRINNAITDLMKDNLKKHKDLYGESNWNDMWDTRERAITNVKQIEDAMNLILHLDDDLSKKTVVVMKMRICLDLIYVCGYWTYWVDYSKTLKKGFGFSAEEKQQYVDKFWKLVGEIRETEPDFATRKYLQIDPFDAPVYESDPDRADKIFKHWELIEIEKKAKIEKEEADRRFKEYWETHASEKIVLEEENNTLRERIAEINRLAIEVSGDSEISNFKEQISQLETEKSNLGMFKGKEKKAMQTRIDDLQSRITAIEKRAVDDKDKIMAGIIPLKQRINEINTELNKKR